MSGDRLPVVVGVDGSDGALAALRWAVAEAVAHRAPLRVVQVLDPRACRRAPYARVAARDTDLADYTAEADRLIEHHLLDAHADDCVRRVFEIGSPAEVLLKHAARARILVLGHVTRRRRRSGEPYQDGPALGGVARACVARSTCPVVIVAIPPQRADVPEPRRVPAASEMTRTPVASARALDPRTGGSPDRGRPDPGSWKAPS
jgi:nucleotide-binding universal stress UspA family protein